MRSERASWEDAIILRSISFSKICYNDNAVYQQQASKYLHALVRIALLTQVKKERKER